MERNDIQTPILQIQQDQYDLTDINKNQFDNQNSFNKKRNTVILHYCYYIFATIQFTYSATFGILFYYFSKDNGLNDSCEQESFKKWSCTCSIFCFISTSFQILRFINRCKNKSESEDLEMNCSKFIDLLEYLAATGLFVCSFGLYITSDSSCGNLYILAKIFYIMTFSIIATVIISICIILCRIKST
ncbi:hypothetical protein ABPG74_008194 [Tetrahymena malaccensis]